MSARADADIWIMAERRTVEEHSQHGHLHANVTMPNSCYMDDIYCFSSFAVAVTFSLAILIVTATAIKKTFSNDPGSQNFLFNKLPPL